MSLSAGARVRLEFAAKAFLVVTFVCSSAMGLSRLHQRAHDDPQNQVDLGAWSVVSKPDWATDDDVRAVRDGAALRGWQTPLLDGASGGVVVGAISAVPSVHSVVALRKVYPNAYDAVIELRRPVAAVQLAGAPPKYVEVDEEGVALSSPSAVRPMREGHALRVIVGAGPVRPHARFGADVIAAAGLCADLARCGSSAADPARRADSTLLGPLDVIDVTNFGGRKNVGESEVCLRMSGYAAPQVPSVAATPGGQPASEGADH